MLQAAAVLHVLSQPLAHMCRCGDGRVLVCVRSHCQGRVENLEEKLGEAGLHLRVQQRGW